MSQTTDYYYSPDLVDNQQYQNNDDYLKQQQEEYYKKMGEFEPIKMAERAREANMPVGLKNVGNTCYFNSLI